MGRQDHETARQNHVAFGYLGLHTTTTLSPETGRRIKHAADLAPLPEKREG